MPLHPIGPESSAGHQPETPTIGSASAGNASASVSFTAPNYLGKPIGTTYTATSTPGSITGTGSSSPISVSGLNNGTSYTFKVKLGNSIVDSLESAASNSITPTAPPPPPAPPPNFTPNVYLATVCCTDNVVYYTTNAMSSTSASEAETIAQGNCTSVGDFVLGVTSIGPVPQGTAYPSISCSPPPPPPSFTPPPPDFTPPPPDFTTPPFFPGFSPFSEYSIAGGTGIMTVHGRKDAKDLVVGDILVAMEISSENINDPSFDWTQWYQENIILNESNLRETEIVSIQERDASVIYIVNGDAYSESHYVLTKKDNITRFIKVSELDNTYMIYSYQDLDFIPIQNLDVLDYEDKVYSINCEPYDNFFTENMLVFDTRD